MTEIEKKALELVNEVLAELEGNCTPRTKPFGHEAFKALCRAIEQHEAFRQEVSDAVRDAVEIINNGEEEVAIQELSRFIIIAKPDPLVDAIGECDDGSWGTKAEYANKLRAALAKRGLEIREKE